MPKELVLLAVDAGPSKGLDFVAKELRARGHYVSNFLGKGKVPDNLKNRLATAMIGADILLLGISSLPETWVFEVEAAKIAKAMGVPYGFFCCNWGEFRRPAFAEVMREASYLFVIDEENALSADDFVGGNTVIVPSGNPAWLDFFNPKMDLVEARAKIGISQDEKLVLVTGSKEPVRNSILWYRAAEAVKDVGCKIRFVVSPHPGDHSPAGTYSPLFRAYPELKMLPADMTTSQALAGADLVITSISLTGVEAACLRVPVIDFITPIDEKWWEELSGSTEWPLAENEASMLINTTDGLVCEIENLIDPRNSSAMSLYRTQETVFQRRKLEGAASRIADTLTSA